MKTITQDDMDAAARGLRMISMHADDLRALVRDFKTSSNFAGQVTAQAARQMLAAKKRVGLLSNPARNWRDEFIDSPEFAARVKASNKAAAKKRPRGLTVTQVAAAHRIAHLPRMRKNPASGKSGVRIVYNRLLGAWYIVRGPSQTPLGGAFKTQEAAQAHLLRQNPVLVKSVMTTPPGEKMPYIVERMSAAHYKAKRQNWVHLGRFASFKDAHDYALAYHHKNKGMLRVWV